MGAGVLLVNTAYEYKQGRVSRYTRVWPPIDLAVAGAMLERDGFSVRILDLNTISVTVNEAIKAEKEFGTIFVTSGSLDRWQCPHLEIEPFLDTVRQLKGETPSARIYILGPNVTMRAKEMLDATKADAAIIGEPELTILALCKNGGDLLHTDGVAYLQGVQVRVNPLKSNADLSTFPVPAFHLLDMGKYYYEIMGDHFTLLETTRGCPFQCTFCSEDLMYGKRYRFKPLELIEKEIDTCVEQYGVKNIYFIDLEFTLQRDFVMKICDMIIRKGYKLRLACQTRTDTVDRELLRKMREAGFILIHYGVESGSPKILESTNKRISLESIKQGVRWAQQAGMEVACFAMMGLPNERVEDMEMTIRFARELNPDYISFHVATPYPGTKLYESVKEEVQGTFPMSYNGIYSEEFIKRMTRKAYMRFYLRPGYLLLRLKKNPRLLLRQFRMFLKYVR
jgi:radical SAM superfamily enzyme YgiQ (UPF0313 family)